MFIILTSPVLGHFSKYCFYYTGAKLWNDIPLSVHSSQTRNAFKNSMLFIAIIVYHIVIAVLIICLPFIHVFINFVYL